MKLGKKIGRYLPRLAIGFFTLTSLFSTSVSSAEGPGFSLTPFSRVAVIGPYIDPLEADAIAKEAATAIATYVATVNDTLPPTDYPADWILGGLEGDPTPEAVEAAILHIPTPFVINPDEPMSVTNRKKVNIVEMCNPLFAKKALGVLPVVADDPTSTIINGYIHAPALPCEVGIYADDEGNINVEMLKPEAIFTLFFTDVLFGEQMEDEDFAAAIQALPIDVEAQIQTIIMLALDQGGFTYIPNSQPLGPVYNSLEEVADVVVTTPYQSPYVHFVYTKPDKSDFTTDDVSAVVASIIETLSLDGVHHPSLDAQLNMDDWRSARPAPLPVPGNLVIEACSPTNAIAAMGLGMEHATALPCEIAIKALNTDGVDGTETLMITYLDPHFMFSALFSDAFDSLTAEDFDAFMALPPLVLEDLQTIVAKALRPNSLGFVVTRPEQVVFEMLGTDE